MFAASLPRISQWAGARQQYVMRFALRGGSCMPSFWRTETFQTSARAGTNAVRQTGGVNMSTPQADIPVQVYPCSVLAPATLTPRQEQVVQLLSRGLTNKEIAHELGIGPEGVKAHVSRLLLRFGARNRVALISSLRSTTTGDVAAYRTATVPLEDIRVGLSHGGNGATNGAPGDIRGHQARLDRMIDAVAPYASADVLRRLSALQQALGAISLAIELAPAARGKAERSILDAIRERSNRALRAVDEIEAIIRAETTAPARRRASVTRSAEVTRRARAPRAASRTLA